MLCTAAAPESIPIIRELPLEPLEPAFGYTDSSTTMKVVKIAEYIPIIGMFVGTAHLIYSLLKRHNGVPGTRDHIFRALGAMTNFGILLAINDIVEECIRRPARLAREEAEEAYDRFNSSYTDFQAASIALDKILKIHAKNATPNRLFYMLQRVKTAAQQVIANDNKLLDTIQDADKQATIAQGRRTALDMSKEVTRLLTTTRTTRCHSILSAAKPHVPPRTHGTPCRPKKLIMPN